MGSMRLDRQSIRVKEHLPDSCKGDLGQKFSDDNDVFTQPLTASIVNNYTKHKWKKTVLSASRISQKVC